MLKLNFGCADDFRRGFVNIDRGWRNDNDPAAIPPPGGSGNVLRDACVRYKGEPSLNPDLPYYDTVDLTQMHFMIDAWPDCPYRRNAVDEIVAHDVFEHIDTLEMRGQKGIIYCMNLAWTLLKPGGILDLVVPCWPGPAPWVDPTHVSVWMADHRYYFDERWNNDRGERGRLGEAYGIRALFRTIGGRSGPDWTPISYAADAPDRHKLFLKLEAVK